MFTSRLLLSMALAWVVLIAQAQYVVKEPEPDTGTRIKDVVSRWDVYPLDKPYERFTDEEKARLRAFYESMPEGDEPPFPKHGFEPLLQQMAIVVGRMNYQGLVSLHISIDETGKATKVDFMAYDNFEAAKAVARLLVNTPYKPAVCSGKPCAMQFPFYTQLTVQ